MPRRALFVFDIALASLSSDTKASVGDIIAYAKSNKRRTWAIRLTHVDHTAYIGPVYSSHEASALANHFALSGFDSHADCPMVLSREKCPAAYQDDEPARINGNSPSSSTFWLAVSVPRQVYATAPFIPTKRSDEVMREILLARACEYDARRAWRVAGLERDSLSAFMRMVAEHQPSLRLPCWIHVDALAAEIDKKTNVARATVRAADFLRAIELATGPAARRDPPPLSACIIMPPGSAAPSSVLSAYTGYAPGAGEEDRVSDADNDAGDAAAAAAASPTPPRPSHHIDIVVLVKPPEALAEAQAARQRPLAVAASARAGLRKEPLTPLIRTGARVDAVDCCPVFVVFTGHARGSAGDAIRRDVDTHLQTAFCLAQAAACSWSTASAALARNATTFVSESMVLDCLVRAGYPVLPPFHAVARDSPSGVTAGGGGDSYKGGINALLVPPGLYLGPGARIDVSAYYPYIIQAADLCITNETLWRRRNPYNQAPLSEESPEEYSGVVLPLIAEIAARPPASPHHCIPRRIKELVDARLRPDTAPAAAAALKLLVNSTYGAFAAQHYRFRARRISALVAGIGRQWITDIESIALSVVPDAIIDYIITDAIILRNVPSLRQVVAIEHAIQARFKGIKLTREVFTHVLYHARNKYLMRLVDQESGELSEIDAVGFQRKAVPRHILDIVKRICDLLFTGNTDEACNALQEAIDNCPPVESDLIVEGAPGFWRRYGITSPAAAATTQPVSSWRGVVAIVSGSSSSSNNNNTGDVAPMLPRGSTADSLVTAAATTTTTTTLGLEFDTEPAAEGEEEDTTARLVIVPHVASAGLAIAWQEWYVPHCLLEIFERDIAPHLPADVQDRMEAALAPRMRVSRAQRPKTSSFATRAAPTPGISESAQVARYRAIIAQQLRARNALLPTSKTRDRVQITCICPACKWPISIPDELLASGAAAAPAPWFEKLAARANLDPFSYAGCARCSGLIPSTATFELTCIPQGADLVDITAAVLVAETQLAHAFPAGALVAALTQACREFRTRALTKL